MTDCNCLIHPFQNDPGTSQHQRVMEELLSGAVKIDARTMADLLDYFVQLSRHINYYDLTLNISDWQPFFRNSIPFALAAIIKYPLPAVENSFELYNSLFDKRPASAGLQLSTWFIYYRFIRKINSWHETLRGSGLPVEALLEALIRNKLQDPVKKFIQYANAAVKTYGIKRIDFSELRVNEVWNIDQSDLYSLDNSFSKGADKFQRINNLHGYIRALFPVFQGALLTLSAEAEKNLESSIIPLKEELQNRHQPHLALLFAFLNIFRQLQNDLNQFTRKHLDYFYKDILKFRAREAIPDRTFVILEIQKQLEKYLLKKGLQVKNGKDDNKQEILFALDDEIVANKTQIAETRALYINNLRVQDALLAEGVYMAPDITAADGVDKPFRDDQPKNVPTLGGSLSKYILPRLGIPKPYPNARLAFILASPVLLLNEGTRKVTITLKCMMEEGICNIPTITPLLLADIAAALNSTYYYINESSIQELITGGIGAELINKLQDNFLTISKTGCYSEQTVVRYDQVVAAADFESLITAAERELIADVIKKRKPMDVLFSGEKNWIEPTDLPETTFTLLTGISSNQFDLTIEAVLSPDIPSVTFYNPENLKEDFGTTLPLVKIELDDRFKIPYHVSDTEDIDNCCLTRKSGTDIIPVSLYHFFRHVKVAGKLGNDANDDSDETKIQVQVCGLKNFVVQNDESVLDVNGEILPFGSRPKIDSNFYLGAEEIFLKKWAKIFINLNWKDKPDNFEKYYEAYQTHLLGNPPSNIVKQNDFKIQVSILQDGNWKPWKHCLQPSQDIDCSNITGVKCRLFQDTAATGINCLDEQDYLYQFAISRDGDFVPGTLPLPKEEITKHGKKKFDNTWRSSVIKITLKCQDFQHEIYPFILARQMMAFGKLPETVDGAVYYSPSSTSPIVFDSNQIKGDVDNAHTISFRVHDDINDSPDGIVSHIPASGDISGSDADRIRQIVFPSSPANPGGLDLKGDASQLHSLLHDVNDRIADISKYAAIIPNEPWTPVISNMALDYTAGASFRDIDLVHLYPFAGTYKGEELENKPALFPTFCDEGTLFLGLIDLVPDNNLNILFKLAEATSDSESEKEPVHWHYLDNNNWKQLRTGFEVLEDGTKNLTTSGIIKFALPENITMDNTVMPKDLHWIKATIDKNSKAVSETIGIHTQAIQVTFTNEEANDKQRLAKPLAAGSISKLNIADTAVKSVTQPYESFDGLLPEGEGHFYVRVSERLRHKGRAIQAFDYERIVLEAFPVVYRVKCINHSFALDAHRYVNDYPYAPGYVELAVIPDLNRLKAGNSFEPKVPVSLIEEIDAFVRRRTSPFVRFRTMNPRYEKVNFCIRVQLIKGKDENYYREKLRQDITEFLAPWAIGEYSKLAFGQCVYRSDIIRLLETTDYVDFITDLKMTKENAIPVTENVRICPDTPRSILVAGDVAVQIDDRECEAWKPYEKCNGETIDTCGNKPEAVIDFCK
ncbi:MAG TPA: hypothetical protein VJ203_16180 [Bacteroidales bacterium]|nr:hypothetical protein [Bacteroidales bacterium]